MIGSQNYAAKTQFYYVTDLFLSNLALGLRLQTVMKTILSQRLEKTCGKQIQIRKVITIKRCRTKLSEIVHPAAQDCAHNENTSVCHQLHNSTQQLEYDCRVQ